MAKKITEKTQLRYSLKRIIYSILWRGSRVADEHLSRPVRRPAIRSLLVRHAISASEKRCEYRALSTAIENKNRWRHLTPSFTTDTIAEIDRKRRNKQIYIKTYFQRRRRCSFPQNNLLVKCYHLSMLPTTSAIAPSLFQQLIVRTRPRTFCIYSKALLCIEIT